jgi:hypothetical protein
LPRINRGFIGFGPCSGSSSADAWRPLNAPAVTTSDIIANAMALSATTLSALFGGTNATAITGDAASAVLALKVAQSKDAEARGIVAERKDPVTITALQHFQKALDKAKDVKSALRDPRVLAVLLPAFGLGDQLPYPGLVQKALLADPADGKGLLAKLDGRFKAAAISLDLRGKGLDALKDPAFQKTLTDGYVQYQYQLGLDEKNAGLSDALYFIRNAAGQKDVYNILGNAVMRRVVTKALGLPDAMAVQSVETQARAITARLKLADLNDPRKLQQIAQRYVMAKANEGGSVSSPLLSLLA